MLEAGLVGRATPLYAVVINLNCVLAAGGGGGADGFRLRLARLGGGWWRNVLRLPAVTGRCGPRAPQRGHVPAPPLGEPDLPGGGIPVRRARPGRPGASGTLLDAHGCRRDDTNLAGSAAGD